MVARAAWLTRWWRAAGRLARQPMTADLNQHAPEAGTHTTGPPASEKPVPYRTILRRRNVRLLAGSRFTSRMAQTTRSYGSMVHLSQAGTSQLGVSLVGSASYVAPLFFGAQGGTATDTMSKRVALAFGFGVQALLCFLAALLIGTSVGSLMFLMFLTSLLMVIVTPSIKAAVAIVSTPSEMASVNAVIALVGSIGSAIGSTMVAPIVSVVSPLRFLEPFGVHLNDKVLAASVIAMPTNFGSTAAGAAADNFINRHVPAGRQGAAFGLKEIQENALALTTIITLGVVSNLFGARIVMIVAPAIVILAALWLLRYSFKREAEPLMTRREAFALLTSGEEALPANASRRGGAG